MQERRRRRSLPLAALMLCLAGSLDAPAAAHIRISTDLTWSEDIRPILRLHCMRCHSPGGMAPSYVDLTRYGTDTSPGARAWAVAIEEELLGGRMPPWSPDPRYGTFANSRRLSELERDMIVAWVRGGAPEGPRKDLLPPPEFTTDPWELGSPDLVVELPEVFVLPAEKQRASTTAVMPIELEEPAWITGFEFRPDIPDSVFRVAAWIVDPPDAGAETLEVEVQVPYDPLADDEDGPTRMRQMPHGRRFLGQWLRGDPPMLLPDGAGKRLRPGSSIELEVEYRRSEQEGRGQELRDRTRLGLHLSREPLEVDRIVEAVEVRVDRLRVERRQLRRGRPVTASSTLPESGDLLALSPHLPDAVESWEARAVYPDGRAVVLAYVDSYAPHWASSLRLDRPLAAARGTRLELAAVFAEAPPPDAPFELVVDYALEDHLVLPEPPEEDGEATPEALTAAAAPGDPNAAAHMDHSPLHGGQFFMAANMYHHLEGTLPVTGEFRLYVYDDFKEPLDPRNFAGTVVFERWDEKTEELSETHYDLDPIPGSDYLRAQIPPELPAEFYASLWLAGERNRYDFYFDAVTEAPAYAPRTAPAGAAAHSHTRPPLRIPSTREGIVSELSERSTRVLDQIDRGEWASLYVPAFDARDLAEALLERLEGLSARDLGQARRAITRVLQGAVELDRAGDLADEGRARRAYERFSGGVSTLEEIFL